MDTNINKKYEKFLANDEKLISVYYPPEKMPSKIGLLSGVALGSCGFALLTTIFIFLSFIGVVIGIIGGIIIGIASKKFFEKLLSGEDAVFYLLTDKRIINNINLGKLRKTSISIEYDKIQNISVDSNFIFDVLFGCNIVKANTSSTTVAKGADIYLSTENAEKFKLEVENNRKK